MTRNSEAVLYMVAARCPYCEEVVRHVSKTEAPIPLDRPALIPGRFCPLCGRHVHVEDWDVQSEHEIEPVLPIQERGGSGE